jgi:hypothetical protein
MTAPEHRGVIQPEVRGAMKEVAAALAGVLPKGFGFSLLVFEMNVPTGFMNYISNANREDMLCALKELIANFEGSGHEPPKEVQ